MVSILIEAGHIMKLNLDAIPTVQISPMISVGFTMIRKLNIQSLTNGEPLVSVSTQPLLVMISHGHGDQFLILQSSAFDGQIQLLNDPRETVGAALKYLGYSLNTTSESELNEAKDLLAATSSRLAAFNTDSAGRVPNKW